MSSEFGLARGFDLFDESLIAGGETNPIAAQVVDRALERIDAAPAGPYFAFLHFFDPHWDYTPPPPYDTRFARPDYRGPVDGTLRSMMPYFVSGRRMPGADLQHLVDLYDGEIAYLDAQIGRLLTELRARGRLENTVVVFTSDHGEEFQEHGMLGRGKTLYGEQTRIPLIVYGAPGARAGERRTDLASLVDVAPTLLALAKAPPLAQAQGTALLERRLPPERIVFGESIRFGNELRSVRQGAFKLIHSLQGDRRMYYDLQRDPVEQNPLARDPSGGALASALAEYATTADCGWHLKLIALGGEPLQCQATLRTDGRIVALRRYFSANVSGGSEAVFDSFALGPMRHTLTFDVTVNEMIGEITFATEPPDAPVVFDIEVDSDHAHEGVFLGQGTPISEGRPVEVAALDPRARGLPRDYRKTAPGCYIRSIASPAAGAKPARLSDGAVERLKSLGYVE